MPRTTSCLAAALLAIAATLALPALPAQAAEITVTTQEDVVDDLDGLVSLREAIDMAAAAAEPSTIVLPETEYELDLCGPDDDTNGTGDLDYAGVQPLDVEGSATIRQTCDGQRVLQITDEASQVTISGVTLTGGEAFDGTAVLYAGGLELHRVGVVNNQAAGAAVASDPSVSGTELLLVDSSVIGNHGIGVRASSATVTIVNSFLIENVLDGVSVMDSTLSVARSQVLMNGGVGLLNLGNRGPFTITETVVEGNADNGVWCGGCGELELVRSRIEGNEDGGIGVSIRLDPPRPLEVNIVESTVGHNFRDGSGAGLLVQVQGDPGEVPPAQVNLTASTFDGNTAASGRGAAIFAAAGEIRVDNSTIASNDAPSGGGIVVAGDVILRHATILDNQAPTAANLDIGGDLMSFASVVAGGGEGGADCVIDGATESDGYNVDGDGSCGFGSGRGDRDNVGDPRIGPLEHHGGRTNTRAPESGSPVLGIVPAAQCTVLDVDQRGVARPQGADCEAGSVEVDETEFGGPPAGGGGGELPKTGLPVSGLLLIGVALTLGGAVLLLSRRLV